uniref:Mitochondrial import inner membrane translocase subunit n=1 Tax=Albugo laibachii Nc14 TaxID=890382 RepID=F0WMZ4_9STRA|nr:Mitochondrial Protein Translocase (MPT) Family puta [Albugo laibachii Nc14]|eukprot:CCA22681.1 Mitochondrial Protein Translocase (MPT) Family puta [Albugo laibachii Nc14]
MSDTEITPTEQNELRMRYRQETMAQAMEELSVNIQMKCFEKCVSKPNGKLDSKQQNCVALCVNRYIDTLNVVSQTMVST